MRRGESGKLAGGWEACGKSREYTERVEACGERDGGGSGRRGREEGRGGGRG